MIRTLQDEALIVFLSDTHIGGDEGHDIFESPEARTPSRKCVPREICEQWGRGAPRSKSRLRCLVAAPLEQWREGQWVNLRITDSGGLLRARDGGDGA
jgi:hypothetical protein